jgi:subtilisin family serine protease
MASPPELPIDKNWAWSGAPGAGVTVAVVDSGVDAAHPAVGAVDRAISVISVAAHDGHDPFALDTNPAPPTDFGAPGIDIRVPWLSGSTIVSTGNSFAAPHVTGLVARLLSKHPHLKPYEVKTVLRAVACNAVGPGATDEN